MDELRIRLKEYRNQYGTPYTHITKSIGISDAYLRMFASGYRDKVGFDVSAKLNDYLKERGF